MHHEISSPSDSTHLIIVIEARAAIAPHQLADVYPAHLRRIFVATAVAFAERGVGSASFVAWNGYEEEQLVRSTSR